MPSETPLISANSKICHNITISVPLDKKKKKSLWQKYWLYLQSNKHELHIQFLFHNSNVQTHKSNGIEQKIHTSFYGHLNMPFIHTYVYHSLSLYPVYTYVHKDICTCIQKTDWERDTHTRAHTYTHTNTPARTHSYTK